MPIENAIMYYKLSSTMWMREPLAADRKEFVVNHCKMDSKDTVKEKKIINSLHFV